MARMNTAEFEKIVDDEIQQAVFWQDSSIKHDRESNYRNYLGLPMGNEVEGRSQVVSWDTFETIESVLPDLIEVFLSRDNIGEFTPTGPEDEAFAAQATDYINYLIMKRNQGFLMMNTWFKDALLAKLGIVRAYWNPEKKVTRENYVGLDEIGLTLMMQNEGVEVIDQTSYDDPVDVQQRQQAMNAINTMAPEQAQQVMAMLSQPPKQLYDVSVKVTKNKGCLTIDNIRPETFVVSKRATRLKDAALQGEIRPFTRTDLIQMGFKRSEVEDLTDYDVVLTDDGYSLKEQAEHQNNTWQFNDSDQGDQSMTEVQLFCGFVQIDYDGDGVAEWRYILRAGNKTLRNEECDGPDFCVLTPIPIPHAIYGLALADVTAPIQEVNTVLQRQYLDSLYLANNPRTYAVNNQVNLDDLLDNRIGGIVRMSGPNMAGPMETTNVSAEALQGIEFMNGQREQRTGVTRYNQGLDADSLNKTATGVTKIMNKGDKRILMIARIFAETGVKDLLEQCLKVVCQYQDHAEVIKLRGEWVSFDPREWSDQMNATVEIADDDPQMIALWDQVIGMQTAAIQSGSRLADEQKIYNATVQKLKAMKVKGIERFVNDPAKLPPPPPEANKPSPEEVLAQAQIQTERIKQEGMLASKQMDLEIERVKLQIKMVELQQAQQKIDIQDRDSVMSAAKMYDDQQREDREFAADRFDDFANRIENGLQFAQQMQNNQGSA